MNPMKNSKPRPVTSTSGAFVPAEGLAVGDGVAVGDGDGAAAAGGIPTSSDATGTSNATIMRAMVSR
jgi:hypothetical protein